MKRGCNKDNVDEEVKREMWIVEKEGMKRRDME